MNNLRSAIAQFSIKGKLQSSKKRKMEDMAGYEPVPPVEQPPYRRNREVGRGTTDPNANCRRSVFNLLGVTSSSKPKKSDVEMTAQSVVEHQKSTRDIQINERKEELRKERQLLQERISEMNEKNNRRRARLESLKKKDDAEKWEDELFETRLKELNNARTVIHTQSTVTGDGVREQIKELNQEIAQVAAAASETQLTKPRHRRESWEHISALLGKDITAYLHSSVDRLNDERFVQAILQIFLARSIMNLINSWYLGKPHLDSFLSRLYSRIRSKEEQTVAGKWRQITFEQSPHGQIEIISQHADEVTERLLELSHLVGYGGDTDKIRGLIRKLMGGAERIRENVRGGFISADLQPWIADYGTRYDETVVKDVSGEFGLEIRHPERCVVLGSIELGMRVQPGRSDEDASSDLKSSKSRPRVLLVELSADPKTTSRRGHRSTSTRL